MEMNLKASITGIIALAAVAGGITSYLCKGIPGRDSCLMVCNDNLCFDRMLKKHFILKNCIFDLHQSFYNGIFTNQNMRTKPKTT